MCARASDYSQCTVHTARYGHALQIYVLAWEVLHVWVCVCVDTAASLTCRCTDVD